MYSITDLGDVDTFECVLDYSVLTEIALKGGFFSYIAGTAAIMTQKYKINECRTNKMNKDTTTNRERQLDSKSDSNNYSVESDANDVYSQRGIHIVNYKNDLPMGKGLSSSAAVCVLVAKCFDEVCLSVCVYLFVFCLCLFSCISVYSAYLCVLLSSCLSIFVSGLSFCSSMRFHAFSFMIIFTARTTYYGAVQTTQ